MLVGREPDCVRIDELLDRARRGRSGALVLRGEAGMGKTALLDYAAEHAEGMTVVRALGVEYEFELQFSGLLELMRPLLEHLPEIPPQQAEALRSALGLGEPKPYERFTICAATLSLIAAAAETNPLLILVDDAHWLDLATDDALLFAAKRLVADSVAILLAVREGGERTFRAPALDQLRLTTLDPEQCALLLAGEAKRPVVPQVAEHLCAATEGNPLALVELGDLLSADQLAGREELPDPVPAGRTLERAFAWRAERLPKDSQRALVIAAVSLSDETEMIVAALESLGIGRDALEPAEDAALLSLADGHIRFRHPLVRSAVFHGAPPSERREAHRALAEALRDRDDPERFAWHLAGAAIGVDEEAATALELAAKQAQQRSSYAAAAAAMERAAALTADEDARPRRLYAAADAALSAGRPDDALRFLAEPLAHQDPRLRAAALRLQGRIEYLGGRPKEAAAVLVEASRLLEDIDRALAVEICTEACSARLGVADAEGMLASAERAEALASGLSNGQLRDLVTLTRGWVLCYVGRSEEGVPLLEQAVAAAEGAELDPLGLMRISGALEWLDRSRDAHRYAERDVARAREDGAVGLLPYLLYQQAWHATRAGLLSEAFAAASEGLGLARELDLGLPRLQSLLVLAAITARRGSEPECTAYVDEVKRPLEETGLVGYRVLLAYSQGLLAVALSRTEDAVREFEAVAKGLGRFGIHSRVMVPCAELAEVHARGGDARKAATALAAHEDSPEPQSPVGRATAARAKGLLAPDDGIDDAFDKALALHEQSDDLWSLARTRLAYGERLRRANRRVDAREQLRPALELFEDQGAGAWAERTRGELRASGETLRRRKSWEVEELTPQELQIAFHVARGMTNREVGAALFLSHKTIEFHLGRVYRKLDMHSRSELISRFAREAAPERTPA
ncbi:MAG TPA: AAA family ATPase [Gaiellaceae bacterium]|nr:AAA family ATPase [Gaiellaceae bacterium]